MTDCSPDALLNLNENIWNIPTFKKIRDLYDNYVEVSEICKMKKQNGIFKVSFLRTQV